MLVSLPPDCTQGGYFSLNFCVFVLVCREALSQPPASGACLIDITSCNSPSSLMASEHDSFLLKGTKKPRQSDLSKKAFMASGVGKSGGRSGFILAGIRSSKVFASLKISAAPSRVLTSSGGGHPTWNVAWITHELGFCLRWFCQLSRT